MPSELSIFCGNIYQSSKLPKGSKKGGILGFTWEIFFQGRRNFSFPIPDDRGSTEQTYQ